MAENYGFDINLGGDAVQKINELYQKIQQLSAGSTGISGSFQKANTNIANSTQTASGIIIASSNANIASFQKEASAATNSYSKEISKIKELEKNLDALTKKYEALASKPPATPKIPKPPTETKGNNVGGQVLEGFGLGALVKGNLIASAISATVGAVKNGIMAIYDLGVQTEQTRISFDIMLGSAEKGKAMFENLKNFADITPFDNSTTYQAGKTLLNYGVAAKDVIPYMQMVGDASAGNAEKFNRMIYSFGQVKSMGRLTGMEMREFANAGFNPLQEMAKGSTTKMAELQKTMHDGKFSFEMLVSAFKSATSEGGRFNGMMDLQSKTVGGLFSTLKGNLETVGYGIYQRAIPALKAIANIGIDISQAFAKWVTPKESENLTDKKVEMNALFEVLKNADLPLDERKNLISQLNGEYKDYLSNLVTENETYASLSKNQELSNDQITKKILQEVKKEQLQPYKDEYRKTATDYIKAEMFYRKNINNNELTSGGWGWNLEMIKDVALQDMLILKEKLNNKAAELSSQWQLLNGEYTLKQEAISKEQIKNLNLYQNPKIEGTQTGENAFSLIQDLLRRVDVTTEMTKNVTKFGISAIPQTQTEIEAAATATAEAATTAKAEEAAKNKANKENEIAARGGLGEAKTINITFTKPLMTVRAEKLDGTDINDYALKAVESITRVLNNVAYGQGVQ